MKKLIRILSVMLSVALATTLVAGAYGGCVSPLRSTLPALLAMTFPFCAIAAIGLRDSLFLFPDCHPPYWRVRSSHHFRL